MVYWHIPRWLKPVYPQVVWDERQSGSQVVHLTFDDGPTPFVTQSVLEMLECYRAKATFFCLGRNVERYPEIAREIQLRGHALGNHTYSHLKGWKVTDQEYYHDIEIADHLMQSGLFRPPYGQIRRRQARELSRHYKVVLWEVMSHDYERRISWERSLKSVLRYTEPGSILVFHDSVKAWPKLEWMLPRVLEHFSAKGYSFHRIEAP